MAKPKRAGQWVKVPEWRGGRVWEDPDGRKTFYIRRTVDGISYEQSTGCTSLVAAAAHLERFEKDPEGYARDSASTAPIYIDGDPDKDGMPRLVREFLAWSLDAKGKGNTPAWVAKQRNALAWWAEKLKGVNLRRASLGDHITPALQGATDRGTRIRVLKAFYGWLRKEQHRITANEDPTFGALSAPAARPAQRVRSKVIPREHFHLVRDHFRALEEERKAARAEKVVPLQRGADKKPERIGPWADALTVQAGTGWHTTEVVRFAASGSIEPLPRAMKVENGAEGVLVCPLHKSGDTHRTAVSGEVIEAAKRLLRHGKFSREWYDRAVRDACKSVKRPDGKVGIPVFTPGRFRHSIATWAFEAGADPFAVSAFLGHKSPSTTKKFYASLATVPKVPTLA
jgi:hypothetical protein